MLIFLDIDGVMVPAKSWKSPELHNDGFAVFSNKATYVLQSLMAEDTAVMLTTSHKGNFTIEEWKSIFKNRGINIKNLGCLPANVNNYTRRDELVNWFNTNNVNEDFIIIDDDNSLNELPGYWKEHLLQTSPYIGLTEEHLEIARMMLRQHLLS